MTRRYPILVERFKDRQSMIIACECCKWEGEITPDDLRNEADYACPECRSPATYKYDEANKCPNCGKLGRYERVLDYCCSRPCMLQAEYAKQLAGRSS